jgi:hypothetical protein
VNLLRVVEAYKSSWSSTALICSSINRIFAAWSRYLVTLSNFRCLREIVDTERDLLPILLAFPASSSYKSRRHFVFCIFLQHSEASSPLVHRVTTMSGFGGFGGFGQQNNQQQQQQQSSGFGGFGSSTNTNTGRSLHFHLETIPRPALLYIWRSLGISTNPSLTRIFFAPYRLWRNKHYGLRSHE